MNSRLGTRIFSFVISIFLVFTLSFITFQQVREKRYKNNMLNERLQAYNLLLNQVAHNDMVTNDSTILNFISRHPIPDLRVSVITNEGRVVFDNVSADYNQMLNHATHPEIRGAMERGSSYIIRQSSSFNEEYFYSATYFPADSVVVRTALPYTTHVMTELRSDPYYIYFALVLFVILCAILYRFCRRLNGNITKLNIFAQRAEGGESLDTMELAYFPHDELGDIAERIINIYRQWQRTKEEQNQLKRELTQNIAHELKTPVASVQGYLETILSYPDIDDERRTQFLRRSFAQIQRLGSLVNDISTLNTMDDGQPQLAMELVDIRQVVEKVSEQTALQMEQRGMRFENLLPDAVRIMGNPLLVYSLFRNLMDNAIAYAGEGVAVSLSAEERPDEFHFVFADNGVGVAEEHLPRLFERFYRIDKGRSRANGGTGLGLAIVKNAVLAHKGQIAVRRNDPHGLVFDFTLKK